MRILAVVLPMLFAAAVAAAEPVEDMRGSEAFKRSVLAVLVKRAIDAAMRRCKGEQVEMSHEYY